MASFDPDILRTTGVKMVADLWTYDLSAELAIDKSSPEELMSHYRDDKHRYRTQFLVSFRITDDNASCSWIIMIRHDSGNNGKPELRVKSMIRKEDADIRISDLISYFRGEIRERDQRELPQGRARLHRQSSTADAAEDDQKVQICMRGDQHRGKKIQKYMVVEAGISPKQKRHFPLRTDVDDVARNQTRAVLNSYSAAPIVAVYLKDDMFEAVRRSRLSDRESWRSFIRTAPSVERDYLHSVQIMLDGHHKRWKENSENMSQQMVSIYNTRSDECFIYDLSL